MPFPSSQRSIQSCPAGQLHNSKEVGRTKTKDLSSYFLERGGRDINKMLRSILLRSGRGGQTGRTKHCAELTTITASPYRARASRPSARKKVASRLLD